MAGLEDTVSIVTGAGTGIGRETALRLAAEGSRVVLAGRRSGPLESTADAIAAAGGQALVRPVDLEDGNAAAELGKWAVDTCGRVDVLINNAGHSTRVRTLRHVEPHEWESVFKVNVEGVYRLTQSVLASMLEHGGGTVVTVSSMAALAPGLLGGVPYSAAKAASFNIMRGLSAELRNQGIRACTVFPGEIDTPILDNRPLPPDAEARSTMPLPEDVAEAILLCVKMPARTLIEQIVVQPTRLRDTRADIAFTADFKG